MLKPSVSRFQTPAWKRPHFSRLGRSRVSPAGVRLLLICLVPALVLADTPARKERPSRQAPTVADYVYGQDSPRQRFDFWQAKSDKPTPVVLLIHGGAWVF